MANRALVLDANILIRAVLGERVRRLMAALVTKRGGDPGKALAVLRAMFALGDLAGVDVYSDYEAEARKRLGARDPDDWPILACALALGCPIWTEDTDFFGCGVATWTSNRVEIFLDENGIKLVPETA